jgi:ribosomal protein L11 methyltransferase
MDWCEIRIAASEEVREAISNRLFELGAQGITENGTGVGATLHAYFPQPEIKKVQIELTTYLLSLQALFPKLPRPKVDVMPVKNENWTEKYKEFYKAQTLGSQFFLKPLWDKETKIPQGRIPILMEPGQAFGTGLHPSTKLCIRLFEAEIERVGKPSAVRCVDIGTGSGILAIVAAKLGVKQITAIDNDPIAVETARENFEVNECSYIVASGEDISKLKGPFDIIFSNILLETHRELAAQYKKLLAPAGALILSGLLGDQRADIDQVMRSHKFCLEESENLQEWAAFLYRSTRS